MRSSTTQLQYLGGGAEAVVFPIDNKLSLTGLTYKVFNSTLILLFRTAAPNSPRINSSLYEVLLSYLQFLLCILDRVDSTSIRLINFPNLTSKLDLLSLHCTVGSLSFLCIYYFSFCCRELASSVPPSVGRPLNTGKPPGHSITV